jgi:hypothetical protein
VSNIEKMLEELFVREAETYIDEKGHLVHVDYVIGGLTLADIEKYSDKVPTRIEDLREAVAKVDFSDVKPITPPGYTGPGATKYYIQKYIDEFDYYSLLEGGALRTNLIVIHENWQGLLQRMTQLRILRCG